MIHVMAIARLGGSAVAATVVGDHAIALIEEEQHLRVPVVGRQRPAMAEHDGLTFAPVLVENLNAVFRFDTPHVTLLKWTSSRSRVRGFFGSHTFVNKLGEKGWVNDELAPLCVVSGGRFGRYCLLLSSASILQCRNLIANIDKHVAKVLKLGLVADRLAVSGNDNCAFRRCR